MARHKNGLARKIISWIRARYELAASYFCRQRLSGHSLLCDPEWYESHYGIAVASAADVYDHYRKIGWKRGYDPNPLFDTSWYISRYRSSLKKSALDPLTHYIFAGRLLSFDPNPFFDAAYYEQQSKTSRSISPLEHYLLQKDHDRHPNAWFDSLWYERRHGLEKGSGAAALAHYLTSGAYRGLAPSPDLERERSGFALETHQRAIAQIHTLTAAGDKIAEPGDPRFLLPHRLPSSLKKIAIFTAIFGGYDRLNLPYDSWREVADFYCFTDSLFENSGAWILVAPDYYNIDPTRRARYYKTHSLSYLSRYDIGIWLDGNIALTASPTALVDCLGDTLDIVSFRHPHRASVEEEAAECIARSRDEVELIKAQMERYRESAYRQASPLLETSVMVFNHRSPNLREFLSRWWAEIDRGSRRDQLSVNYCIDNVPGLRVGCFSDSSTHQSDKVKVVKHIT